MDDIVKKYRMRRDARIAAKKAHADDQWITMRGTHVLIDDGGQVSKGPEKLKNVVKQGGGYKSKADRKYGSSDKYSKAMNNGWNVKPAVEQPKRERRPLADIHKEFEDNRYRLEDSLKKRDKAKENYEMSKGNYDLYMDDPGTSEEFKEMFRKDLAMTQKKYQEAKSEVDRLSEKDRALKKELSEERDAVKKEDQEAIRSGPVAYVRSEKVVTAIRGNESLIRKKDYEKGACVDKNGRLLFEATDGKASQIDLEAYKDKLKDTVFTHNHPRGSTLSVDDVSCAVAHGMAEVRACHRGGAYSLVRQYSLDGEKPANYMDFAWDYQESVAKYDREVIDPIWRRGPQVQETADRCNKMYDDYRRLWLELNSKKYGWIYSEE